MGDAPDDRQIPITVPAVYAGDLAANRNERVLNLCSTPPVIVQLSILRCFRILR